MMGLSKQNEPQQDWYFQLHEWVYSPCADYSAFANDKNDDIRPTMAANPQR